MFSGQAQAAVELANVAASDNRLGTIALLFAPVVGWVGFNMAQPFFNQMNRMNEIKSEAAGASAGGRKKRGLAGAVGLGAALSMAAAQQAEAATELSQLAASDNRCAQQLLGCMCTKGLLHLHIEVGATAAPLDL
jgi:photosystem II PsbY protein